MVQINTDSIEEGDEFKLDANAENLLRLLNESGTQEDTIITRDGKVEADSMEMRESVTWPDGTTTTTSPSSGGGSAIAIEDDGSEIQSDTAGLNFGTNVSVSDDGDNTVTITSDKGIDGVDVQDNGTTIESTTTAINFRTNLAVGNSGGGEVNVDTTITGSDLDGDSIDNLELNSPTISNASSTDPEFEGTITYPDGTTESNTPISPEVLQKKGYAVAVNNDGTVETAAVTTGGTDPSNVIETQIDWLDNNGGGDLYLPESYTDGSGPVVCTDYVSRSPSTEITFIGGTLRDDYTYGDPNSGDPEGNTPALFDIGEEEPKFETSLTADATYNDETISVSSTSDTDGSINEGDLIAVQADTEMLVTGDPGEGMGEAHKVVDVSGTDITLEGTLSADYNSADNSSVFVWDPVQVHFKGVEIFTTQARVDAEEYTRGIRFLHCINSTVEDCFIHDLVVTGIKVWGGYDIWIHNNKIDDIFQDSSSGYGVAVSREANQITIEGNQIRRCRHNVSSYNSGGTTCRGWPQLTVRGNELTGGSNAMVDAHVGVWRLICTGNTASNQGDDATFNQPFCNIGARHTIIADNHVETCTVFTSDRGDGESKGTVSVKGNTVQHVTGSAVVLGPGRVPQQVDIQGNSFFDINNVAFLFEDVSSAVGTWDRVNITNNYVEGDGNTTALEYTGTSGPVIERFDLKDNTFDNFGTGIEISYVNNGNINGNSIHVSDDGIVLDNCNDCFVTGNRCEFEYSNKTGIVVTNSTEVHVQNNFLKNFNTAVSGATTETDNVLI